MILRNITDDDYKNISKLSEHNRVLFVFIDKVDFNAQLFLALNTELFKLLELIYICGGVVRRSDLISIAYKGDKNIYSSIRQLKKYKLIKLEGERDSNIFLTATAISILKKSKVKNGIPFSKGTNTVLDKAEFILSLRKEDPGALLSISKALEYVIDTKFEIFSSIPKEKAVEVKEMLSRSYKELMDSNCYLLENGKTIGIYASDKRELMRKFKLIVEMNNYSRKFFDLNITKVIVPSFADLGDFHVNEFVGNFYEENKEFGIDFEYIEVVSIDGEVFSSNKEVETTKEIC